MPTQSARATTIGEAVNLAADQLRPNSFNPNFMDAETRAKERLSIERFGFVVPIIVRDEGTHFEIIDGQHRWEIGQELGMTEFPCWNLGVVTDDIAMQLTPILNELHGEPDDAKLSLLLKELISRNDEQAIREVMPFDRQRFDQLIGELTVDWDALERQGSSGGDAPTERWVERVYRMPSEAANVVDQAIAKALEESGASNDWQGLEFIAAEFMGR